MNLITTLFAAAVILKWIGYGYPATLGWFWIIGWFVVATALAAIAKAYLEEVKKAGEDRRREEFVKSLYDQK